MKLQLEVIEGPHAGAKFAFDRRETFLAGRNSKAHLALIDDPHFSRNHFLLEVDPPRCLLRDLNSRNGTKVNGERRTEVELKDGDVISGGRTKIQVKIEHASPPTSVACLACGQQSSASVETVSHHVVGEETCAFVCDGCREELAQRPQPVPGYELIRALGRGGMGVVHLARRLSTGQTVAIKLILPESVTSERLVQLFLREASVLSQLDHPRIVRFHEMGMAHGQFFLAMEYVESVDLMSLLTPLAVNARTKTICAVGCQVLDALSYAHKLGFVHRDIKPSNVLVAREGQKLRTKLADFGLAKNFENGGFSGMTRIGEVRGSLPFMPPEQIIDCRLSQPSADIYSVGATLYRWLSGSFPHNFPDGKDPYAIVLDEAPVPLQDRWPEAPADIAELVHSAMARDPAERFVDADEMRRALLTFAK